MNLNLSPRVLSFNYTLKDASGEVIDSSHDGPMAFLVGSGQIIPALEAEMVLMTVGQKKNVKLSPEQAYGMPEPKMVMDVPRQELAHLKIELGGFLQLQLTDQTKVVRITNITDEVVTLDGNHPLAGQALEFDVEIVESREATAEELAHGHAHGPHGHQH